MQNIEFGQSLTCAETGKHFVAERDGISVNYARDSQGNIFSDEGVDIRERREMLDRSRPFACYISSDGRTVTGWKGNILGAIVDWSPCQLTRPSWIHGRAYRSIKVRDVHGGAWYGRGSPGVCVTLRPCKG